MDNAIQHKDNDIPAMDIKIKCYEDSRTSIIKLQAHIKGFIIRRKLKSTPENIKNNSDVTENFNSISKSLIVLYNITLSQRKD
jgi:hypothetical protein